MTYIFVAYFSDMGVSSSRCEFMVMEAFSSWVSSLSILGHQIILQSSVGYKRWRIRFCHVEWGPEKISPSSIRLFDVYPQNPTVGAGHLSSNIKGQKLSSSHGEQRVVTL